MANTWAKLPTAWIRYDDKLRCFSVKNIGASIAALKIYLAIVLKANFKPNDVFDKSGCASLSFTEFEDLTGMSRALVAQGLKKLKEHELIVVEKEGRPNIYRLTSYDDERGWSKLPKRYLFGSENLGKIQKITEFSMRHRAHLNALRIYLLLLANGNGKWTLLSYDKITEYTGMSREFIHPAISVLIDMQLINVSSEETSLVKTKSPNKYHFRGLGS